MITSESVISPVTHDRERFGWLEFTAADDAAMVLGMFYGAMAHRGVLRFRIPFPIYWGNGL